MDPGSNLTGADDDIERLSSFLTELRASGYLIGPDRVLAAHALLITLKNRGLLPKDQRKLKTLLAPVVCSSASMQREFYVLFDEWLAREHPSAATETPTGPAGLEPILKSVQSRVMTARGRVLVGLATTLLFTVFAVLIGALLVSDDSALPERLPRAPVTGSADQVEFVNQGPIRSTGYIALTLLRLFWPLLVGMAILIVGIVLRWRFIWRGQARIILDRQPGLKDSIPARLRQGRSRVSLFAQVRRSPWARRFLWVRPGGRHDLDVPATLRSSLNHGGLLTPVNRARQAKPEYLVLVDRLSSRDHQSAWCDALVDRLEEMGVPIVRYDFAGDPRWCFSRRGGPAGFALGDLRLRHPDHRLFVFSDCRALANPVSGDLAPWAEQLLAWPEHALLTPEPRSSWGALERMLIASGFKLAQADPEGLAQFIDTVEVTHTKVTAPVQPAVALPETLRAFAFRWTGPEVPPEGEVRALLIDLHWYLGVEGYDLFCACAVYPELDWNLTLYMSQVMSTSDSKFQEKDLAKLARLPWFRRGRMPDWLRLLLLDDLGSERERLVRGALERLLLGQTGAHDIRFDLPLAAGNRETIEAIARSVLSELARQEVPSGPLRDPIFVSFMHSRPRDRLAVTLPARRRPPSDDRSALRALATPSRKREFADTGLGPSLAQQEPTRAGRPFWVYAVVFLYFSLVLLLYSVAVLNIAKDAAVTFLVFLFAVVSAQVALLWVPVRFAQRRPIRRRSLWPTLIGSGAFAAVLILLLGNAIGLVYGTIGPAGQTVYSIIFYASTIIAVLTWIFWSALFYLASFTEEPTSVGIRLHRYLIKGSVLELLVAVAAHIIIRRKGECSAGLVSFIGICCGLAVMLIAFGPSVIILFAARSRSKQAGSAPKLTTETSPLPGISRIPLPSFGRAALALGIVLAAVALWDFAFPAISPSLALGIVLAAVALWDFAFPAISPFGGVSRSFLYHFRRLVRYGELNNTK